MFDFWNDKPLECPDERYVVKARHTGSVIVIRDMLNAVAKIPPLNAMENAVALDISESVSARYEGREQYRITALVRLGCLIERERQRRATETDSAEPAAPAVATLTDTPAADTRLKTLDEKADAALDVLNVITGKVAPNAAFALRTFSDGRGRFLPVDSPAAEADTEPETPAAWTVTDASGRTICAGTDSNAADLVQKALEGYAPGEYTLHCPGDGEAVSF